MKPFLLFFLVITATYGQTSASPSVSMKLYGSTAESDRSSLVFLELTLSEGAVLTGVDVTCPNGLQIQSTPASGAISTLGFTWLSIVGNSPVLVPFASAFDPGTHHDGWPVGDYDITVYFSDGSKHSQSGVGMTSGSITSLNSKDFPTVFNLTSTYVDWTQGLTAIADYPSEYCNTTCQALGEIGWACFPLMFLVDSGGNYLGGTSPSIDCRPAKSVGLTSSTFPSGSQSYPITVIFNSVPTYLNINTPIAFSSQVSVITQ